MISFYISSEKQARGKKPSTLITIIILFCESIVIKDSLLLFNNEQEEWHYNSIKNMLYDLYLYMFLCFFFSPNIIYTRSQDGIILLC